MKKQTTTTHVARMPFDALSPNGQHEDRFHTILGQLSTLHDLKARDYGTGEDPIQNLRASVQLGIEPWKGCLIRMNDKMFRLSKFAKYGKLTNESAIDSLNDIAVYAILCRMLLEENPE
jgi:hypothetical protein